MNRSTLQQHWQQLPETAVRRLQAEQLRRHLRTVVLPFSAHYRKMFEENGLSRIPSARSKICDACHSRQRRIC